MAEVDQYRFEVEKYQKKLRHLGLLLGAIAILILLISILSIPLKWSTDWILGALIFILGFLSLWLETTHNK